MVILRVYVFDAASPTPQSDCVSLQGKYTDRPSWPCMPGRLWSPYCYLRPLNPFTTKFKQTGWHNAVDEPGAYCSATVRVEHWPPNKILRLLLPRNGRI